ncbi:MAG: MFS transporter [Pirellulaceae bacterium]|nr:MFS transporter [Pirellulaceae bacterium]
MNPNRNKLMIASFLTLIAAGVGFSIRAAILGDWSAQFGFTKQELGSITGGGLVGFGITIILCSFILDRVGYKPILMLAFLLHVLSGVVTLAATPIFNSMGREATFTCLWWGMFLFALANGLCEAVINPLIATIYPKKKTHYLNILHAGWPGGLILGGVFAYLFAGSGAFITQLRWEIPIILFLVPTLIYGWLTLKEEFPQSEASSAGISLGDMLRELASPILLLLFVLHALVGYVELGTDAWITNIMENVISGNAILLFVYTSALMFVLRFFAGPIVERINPIGLLMVSAALGALGLYLLGSVTTGVLILLAATIYGLGKTFLWPTMLGVVAERFPRGGAVTMGMIGGIGMLSAGLLGGPGIGYKQDYYASKDLEAKSISTFNLYKAEKENSFLFLPVITGLDGAKVGVVTEQPPATTLASDVKLKTDQDRLDDGTKELDAWWNTKAEPTAAADAAFIKAANIHGGKMALKWTAAVPLSMFVGYLVLFLYFQSTGGYVAEHLEALDSGAGDAPSEPTTTGEGSNTDAAATGAGDEPAAE